MAGNRIAGDFLGALAEPVGPLPLGVWLGGALAAYYVHRHASAPSTAAPAAPPGPGPGGPDPALAPVTVREAARFPGSPLATSTPRRTA